MKYESKRVSGQGATVYQFAIGKEEMFCLKQILDHAVKYTPQTTETHIFRSRVRNMIKTLGLTLSQEKIRIPKLTRG